MRNFSGLLLLVLFFQVSAENAPRHIGSFDQHQIIETPPLKKLSAAGIAGCTENARRAALVDASFNPADLRQIGWRIVSKIGNVITLSGCTATAPSLAAIPGILFVKSPSAIHPLMDSARRLTNTDRIHGTRPGGVGRELRGAGVLVGIIDTEFDTHHPAFLDSSGRTRFVALWDQDDTTSLPNRFGYGVIKNRLQLEADRNFGLGTDFHGTTMASFAAGSDYSTPYYGVAPEALLAGVKMGDSDNVVIDGLHWLFSLADSLKLPCVVNMSLGISTGPHDGSSLVDRVIDTLGVMPGHVIVGAAGNDGNKKSHVALTVGRTESKGSWITGSNRTDRIGRPVMVSEVDFWGEVGKRFTATFYLLDTAKKVYKQSTKQFSTQFSGAYRPDTIVWTDADTRKQDTVFFQAATRRASPLNGRPRLQAHAISTHQSLVLGLQITVSGAGGTVHGWNGAKKPFRSFSMAGSGFLDGDTTMSVNEIGGTARQNITVGSYVSKQPTRLVDGTLMGGSLDPKNPHPLAGYSSRGPTLDGRIKPDITAAGSDVTGAMPRNMHAKGANIVWWPHWPDTSSTNGRYMATGGTSVSSPIVAGIVALMLQIDPTLTTPEARTILQETAITDVATGPITTYNNAWGAGKADALGAIRKMLGIAAKMPVTPTLLPASPIVQRGDLLFVKTRRADAAVIMELSRLDGRVVLRESGRGPFSLSLQRFPAGIYLARVIEGDLCSRMTRVPVLR